MAAIALHAVLAEVSVIFIVASRALLRHFYRARRFAMTGRTLQLGVRAQQWKVCFRGMIENP